MEYREAKLYEPVKKWFENQGYQIYPEVGIYNYRFIDIVAVKDNIQIAIELKISFNKSLWHQIYRLLKSFTAVYAAVGSYPKNKNIELCALNGIGILSIKEGLITEIIKPNYNYKTQCYFPISHYQGLNQNIIPGKPIEKGDGPTFDVLDRVKEYINQHPKCLWKEIFSNVPSHYYSEGSMKTSLSQWRGFSLRDYKREIAITNT